MPPNHGGISIRRHEPMQFPKDLSTGLSKNAQPVYGNKSNDNVTCRTPQFDEDALGREWRAERSREIYLLGGITQMSIVTVSVAVIRGSWHART